MTEINASVLGATGDAGKELTRILRGHSNVVGLQTPTREELPEFEGTEVLFSALPNGESSPYVARFRDLGCTVIDLSDELRLPSPELYKRWHPDRDPHPAPHLVRDDTPYGLPELNRDELQPGTKLVSMPGCYPTAALLALMPLVSRSLIKTDLMVVDAISGYSGRGKDADNSDVIDERGVGHNVKSYKIGREHQHVGEMEQMLGVDRVFFSPSVGPFRRGLRIKANAQLAAGVTADAVQETLEDAYAPEPFIAVLTEEKIPDIADTTHTDKCHIGFVVVANVIQIGSSIDNLRKGAASQAVQVFNLIHGLPEETGLTPKSGWQPTTAE